MDFSSEFSTLNDTLSNVDLNSTYGMDMSSQNVWNSSFFGVGFVITLFISILIMAFFIIVYWIIFTKAGEEGWKSLIPIYNVYILYKITWGNGLIFLLLLVPFVNFIVGILTINKLSKCFGHGLGFTLGLLFLPIIFLPLLAFGDSRYEGY